ncbi:MULTISPECIES: hypothetical protein [Acinetobacter]|uniref:hypothetical protein n=1 Tax=Acinetobacter TaxID=469 RepID=UPI0022E22CBF|nr:MULTISPECIES: hypothetical protein [Acinetobacter]MDI1224259.1 hypothetical protein [Acinetobacter sp.]
MIADAWKSIVRFYRNEQKNESSYDLSDPLTVRLPLNLLGEVTNQSKAIGGDRYRSKHLVNLIDLGAKFYRINSDFISTLPIEHINLITRLHYVFNELKLQTEKVAFELDHDNTLKVSSWLNGSQIPSFEDLDRFSDIYFINTDWIKFGNSSPYMPELTPFLIERKSFHYWTESLQDILQEYKGNQPHSIKLIRGEEGSLLVSVGYGSNRNDWKVRSIYYSNLKLQSMDDIGNSGFHYLVELAILCMVLYKYIRKPSLIISYNIKKDEMNALTEGEKLPIHFNIWGQTKANFWYESIFDITDTNNHNDSSYWIGATELFNAIQDSPKFKKYCEDLQNEPLEQIGKILNKSPYSL